MCYCSEYTGGSHSSEIVSFDIVYLHIPSDKTQHEVAAVCRRSSTCLVHFLSASCSVLLSRDSDNFS